MNFIRVIVTPNFQLSICMQCNFIDVTERILTKEDSVLISQGKYIVMEMDMFIRNVPWAFIGVQLYPHRQPLFRIGLNRPFHYGKRTVVQAPTNLHASQTF